MAALAGQEVDLCDGAGPRRVTVAAACRALNVPTSSFYDWKAGRPPSTRDTADAYALDAIIEIHARSRGTYGVRRVHAELALGGHEHVVSRRRVARLMRAQRLQGVHRRRWRHPGARETATWPDHVNRQFVAEGPNRLWVTDITQHRTSCGWVYCAVVLDVYSRRVVGWSIADHLRTELVVDALEMAGCTANLLGPWCIRTAAPNTRRGCSGTGCGKPACWDRWAASRPATTTP